VGSSYTALSEQGKVAFAAVAKNVGVAVEDVAKMSSAKLKTPKGPGKAEVVINNARFDIKQNFAEGYDPDRIAAAFVDQLGAATMYRTQSAFSGQPGTG
jgi:hypothetical protein